MLLRYDIAFDLRNEGDKSTCANEKGMCCFDDKIIMLTFRFVHSVTSHLQKTARFEVDLNDYIINGRNDKFNLIGVRCTCEV